MSKGSEPRITDRKRFRENHDKIDFSTRPKTKQELDKEKENSNKLVK